MNLSDIIDVGNEVISSIDDSRLENDQVLRNKVEKYKNLRQLAQSLIKTSLDKDIEEELLSQLANSIREVESQLDIISPD